MKIMAIVLLVLSYSQSVYSEEGLHHHGAHEHSHEHSDASEGKKITLNHGSKWLMDSHTRDMFLSMGERLHTENNAREVGIMLSDDLQKLIQGCTMTGAAHDQLHIFLEPYMSAVNELSENGTDEAFQKVKHALDNYQNYFE